MTGPPPHGTPPAGWPPPPPSSDAEGPTAAWDSAPIRGTDSAAFETRAQETGWGSDSTAPSQAGAGGWVPGVRVGPFILREPIGRGGMGTVFRAEHAQLGVSYAIKAVPLRAQPTLLERFRRESRAQAAVDAHPNIVRVHAAGEAFGHLYLVQDLVPGGSLQERIEETGPLDWRQAAQVVAALGRGLAHMHSKGILHRDLKPGNVMFDESGTPMLTDFGLARLAGEESLTRTGAFLGTPAYMAPEQVRGAKNSDERTDVYGLGATLFDALTGAPPFTGGGHDCLRQVLMVEPDPPSQEGLEGIPPAMDAIVLRALAKAPQERYPTAGELADDLERLLRGEQVHAPTPGRRRRRGPLLGVALLAAGLVGVGGWLATRRGGEASGPAPAQSTEGTPPAPTAQARSLVEQAARHAAKLELAALDLLGEARELDAAIAAAAVPGLSAAALGSWKSGARSLDQVTRFLDQLRPRGGVKLPPEAAAPYLALARAQESAHDWRGLADSMQRLRRAVGVPQVPVDLGRGLGIQALGLISRGKLREGFEAVLLTTRAGLRFDLRPQSLEALRQKGVLDRHVREHPGDWAARYWRARGTQHFVKRELGRRRRPRTGSATASLVERCAQDWRLVLAEPDLPPLHRESSTVLSLTCLLYAQGTKAYLARARQVLAAGFRRPWLVASEVATELTRQGRHAEALPWARQAAESVERRYTQAGSLPREDRTRRARTWEALAACLVATRRYDEVEPALAKATRAGSGRDKVLAIRLRLLRARKDPRAAAVEEELNEARRKKGR